jgi:hypothetical protein
LMRTSGLGLASLGSMSSTESKTRVERLGIRTLVMACATEHRGRGEKKKQKGTGETGSSPEVRRHFNSDNTHNSAYNTAPRAKHAARLQVDATAIA